MGAVVVAGGTAARMDGVDKSSIEVAGETLLEHALAALAEIPDIVVVGEEVPTSRPVSFTWEDPFPGGPAAGLLAGIRAFPAPPRQTVVLAVDMPRVSAATVRRLMLRAAGDGAVLVDAEGRRQHLCAVYDVQALLKAAPEPSSEHGLPVHRLVGGLDLVEVEAVGAESHDIDSWSDLHNLT